MVGFFLSVVGPARAETQTLPPGGSSVEVRGALVPHSAADPIAASTVVRGPELEAAGQSSADVLARVPGVVVQRTGAKSDLATASIRGSDSTQVPVYVAGIRVNDDVSGTADLSTIPLWMMDRVEVFRGNAPANGDQLGIGGAVFFWPRLPKTTRLGAGASAGSFGSLGGFVSGEVGSDKASALIAVRRDQSDNDYEYVNDNGTRSDATDDRVVKRRNGDFVAHDAWAIGRYKLSRTDTVSTVMNAYDREQGVTGVALEPATYARGTVRRLLTGVSGRFGCPGARDTCKVDVQGSLLSAQLTFTDPGLEVPALHSPMLANGGERAVVRAFVTADVGAAFTLGGGITQSVESIRIEKPGSLTRQGHRESSHLVATATVNPAPPFRIFGLAALDCHTTSGVDEQFGRPIQLNSGTCGTLEPAFRLGTSYGVSRHVELVANAGRYVRMPSLSELYGTSPLVQGNPALLPETGKTVDAGVRAAVDTAAGRYGLDTFAFARWADDMIRYRTTSFGVAGPYNVGRARILGVEAALSAEWLRALRAQLSATVMDPRDTTEGTVESNTQDILPLTPRLALSARLEAFATQGLEALRQDRVAVALVYVHRASRYAEQAGQIVLPEQNVVDVEVTTAHLGGAIIGRAAVRNVFDAPQADVLGMPLPGRSFHAEIEAWW